VASYKGKRFAALQGCNLLNSGCSPDPARTGSCCSHLHGSNNTYRGLVGWEGLASTATSWNLSHVHAETPGAKFKSVPYFYFTNFKHCSQ